MISVSGTKPLLCVPKPNYSSTVSAFDSSILIPVQKKRLYADVLALTSVMPARNHRNLDALNYAAQRIAQEFSQLDCVVEWQGYSVKGNQYKNVLATFGDVSRDRVVIGAHYDVCGDQPGADDNASAVAGLLEVARLLNELKPALDYGVEFVAYSLEEPPYFATQQMGSAVHARALAESKANVRAMICLEMIGYFSDQPDSQRFPVDALKYVYPTVGNFITVVGPLSDLFFVRKVSRLMKKAANISVQTFAAPQWIQAIGLSDQRNYWANGYRAVMINDTSFYRNPHYHQTTDTIQTLDFDRMAEVVKGVYWAATHL